MTIQQLLQSVQDDARPDQGIQFHLAQLSLRGRDIAGTRIVMFIIISRYVFCDLITILLQNIYIYCRRFLTCFFPENIGSSPVEYLSQCPIYIWWRVRGGLIWYYWSWWRGYREDYVMLSIRRKRPGQFDTLGGGEKKKLPRCVPKVSATIPCLLFSQVH